jgi:hypothetical protein
MNINFAAYKNGAPAVRRYYRITFPTEAVRTALFGRDIPPVTTTSLDVKTILPIPKILFESAITGWPVGHLIEFQSWRFFRPDFINNASIRYVMFNSQVTECGEEVYHSEDPLFLMTDLPHYIENMIFRDY